MPRPKTISDEEILTVARSLFLEQGATASTRALAKRVGISEAVIFQRFSTKENLFFSAMALPEVELDVIFNVHPGNQTVLENLHAVSLQIMGYFLGVMPIFLSVISHPSFKIETFLQRHPLPRIQIEAKLLEYLSAEAELGRVSQGHCAAVASLLISRLHHLALSEHLNANPMLDRESEISAAIAALWEGLEP